MRRTAALTLALVLACASLPVATIGRAGARASTPSVASRTDGLLIVASGLTNPRGMAWGPDGTLYVALAGSGGHTPGVPVVPPPIGPYLGGPTGSVVRIEHGCPVVVADHLPSTRDAQGGVIGVADLAVLRDQLYALIAAGGGVSGNPGTSSGVYQVNTDGTTLLVADTSAWAAANPPEVVDWTDPPQGFPRSGIPFAMVADETAGLLWVVDSHNGRVLTVAPDGTIALAADLSAGYQGLQPTGIALAPEGGVYVGNLTSVPYPDGAAKVVHVTPGGTVTEVWTGLTAVTGVAVGADGGLYVLELSTGNTEGPPFLRPHSGRVVRQMGKDRLQEVATGLLFPIALDVGPDGALYVAQPAFGADDGSGVIVRVETTAGDASPVGAASVATPECTAPIGASGGRDAGAGHREAVAGSVRFFRRRCFLK